MQPPNYPPPPPPTMATNLAPSPRPTTPRSTNGGPSTPSRSGSKTPVIGYPQPLQEIAPPAPAIPAKEGSPLPTRRSSLGNLLRRSKSTDRIKKGSKNAAPAPPVPQSPPRLPEIPIQNGGTPLKNFGGSPQAYPMNSLPSAPKQSMDASTIRTGFNINEDPYSGVGSITNRGRYSYASSTTSTVNGPRRLRKRKDPTPFNILVIGARNSGKTSFLQFLKHSLATKAHKRGVMEEITNGAYHASNSDDSTPSTDDSFTKEYIEADIDGERVGITLWDSAGYEKSVVDLQLRETVAFIESKFEETFAEETRISRNPSAKDTRIHCAFFLLDPIKLDAGKGKENKSKQVPYGLNEDLDLQVFRALQGKTTVIPVISKADTCTTSHMAELKKLVVTSLEQAKLNPLEALEFDDLDPIDDYLKMKAKKSRRGNGVLREEDESDEDDDGDRSSTSSDGMSEPGVSSGGVSNIIPLSVISPDHYGEDFVGREFPWGFADPYNSQHCDFVRLREAVFSEWRGEMRVASHEIWYENWRTSRLSTSGGQSAPRRGRGMGRAL